MHPAGLPRLALAELRKHLLLTWRYPLQPVLAIAMLLAVFALLAGGARHYPALGLFEAGDQRVMVASFVCWIVSVGAVGQVGTELEDEIRAGLLEPVFLSRHGAWQVILVRCLAGAVPGLLLTMSLLAMLAWYMGAALHLGVAAWLALALLVLSLSGFGLALAGLVVQFTRAGALASAVHLGVGVVVARQVASARDDGLLYYPLASAIELYSRAVLGTALSLDAVLLAAAWAVAMLGAGTGILRLCVRQARRAGTLAHY